LDLGQSAPRIRFRGRRFPLQQILEFLTSNLRLTLVIEDRLNGVAKVGEQFDIERCVDEPLVREWTCGPVCGRMFLREVQTEKFADNRCESNTGEPGQSASELGVKQ